MHVSARLRLLLAFGIIIAAALTIVFFSPADLWHVLSLECYVWFVIVCIIAIRVLFFRSHQQDYLWLLKVGASIGLTVGSLIGALSVLDIAKLSGVQFAARFSLKEVVFFALLYASIGSLFSTGAFIATIIWNKTRSRLMKKVEEDTSSRNCSVTADMPPSGPNPCR